MTTTASTEDMSGSGFIAPVSAPDEHVERMYATDLRVQGYVANQTRVWAHSPESLAALSYALTMAVDKAGIDVRHRALLVTSTAAAMGDAYCSLAFGSKLAAAAGEDVAAAAVTGHDDALPESDRALARWARLVTRDPNGTRPEDVERLRSAGYDDEQVFAITLFVALRIAFSTVNDALGAEPDQALLERAPQALRDIVRFGRVTS
jgi:alkylhydroperoxidase family enzyme